MVALRFSARAVGAWLAAAACCALPPSTALWAVEPSVGGMRPYGFQRGTEVDVQISGARLGDAQELLFYSPGVSVVALTPTNDGAVQAKLKLAPDCRLGVHALRLRTATGVSNLHTFSVGALPEVAEAEPNSDFAAPQAVPLGCVVNGVVQNEDQDYFVVEAKAGQRVSAELEGLRLGVTFFDPYIAILNSARFELARSDDSALLRQDGVCQIVAPEDGKYVIQVRESSYGGNGSCLYRLHIGSFPRPRAIYPAGGKPGEQLNARLLGDAAGETTRVLALPTSVDGEVFDVHADDAHGVAPSPNRVRVVDLANALEAEPNNDFASATAAGDAPLALNGVIETPGDVDCFKFRAKAGQVFDVRVYARNVLRSPLDSVLNVYRASGAGVGGNDDSGGPDSYLRFQAPADEEYIVRVNDHLGGGGPLHVYRVEVAPVRPAITMTLPERQQYVPTTLTVPQGNRMALMVAARRDNWGGDLQMSFEGLPAGLTAQAPLIPGSRNDFPVLFTAAADAAPAGALVDLVGKPTDQNLQTLSGRLHQRTMLVRGQNNIDVWGHDAYRAAAVVAQPAPFEIEIVQPKAPLPRNGSMNLKIVAKRQQGFGAPINVFLLYNPPGVGSSASIQIPQDQLEVVIPLTANGGAGIQKWPIVVIGRAPHGGGTVETATQMAELDISDSFFDVAFQKAAVEQAKETGMLLKLTHKREFAGPGKAELLGLPAGTTTTPVEFAKDSQEIVFTIKCAADARPNTYRGLVVQAVVHEQGEPVTHVLGGGELRVDPPPPPPPMKAAPAAQPMPMPMPMPQPMPMTQAPPPPPKPLSRLEQLRLQREQELKEKEGG